MGFKRKLQFNIPAGEQIRPNIGLQVNRNGNQIANVTPSTVDCQEPTVVVYATAATLGPMDVLTYAAPARATSAIATAAMQFYTQVRSANASLSSYTQADIIKYFYAITGLHIAAGALEKCFRSLGKFAFENYAYRGVLNRALWADPDAAAANYSNYVAHYNIIRRKLESFPLMGDVRYLTDQVNLVSEMYVDDMLKKTCVYTFMPSGIPYWNQSTSDPTALIGQVTFVRHNGTRLYSLNEIGNHIKAEELLAILEAILKVYSTDDDVNKISAEILKAFPNYKVKLPAIPEEIDKLFPWAPVFSINMNDAVRNASVMRIGINNLNPVTTYFPGLIEEAASGDLYLGCSTDDTFTNITTMYNIYEGKCQPDSTTYMELNTQQAILRSAVEDPDDNTVAEITRFVHTYRYSTSGSPFIRIETPGVNIITGYIMYKSPVSGARDVELHSNYLVPNFTSLVSDVVREIMYVLATHAAVKAVPMLSVIAALTAADQTDLFYPVINDWDNFTLIDESTLSTFHQITVADEFNIGSFNKR